MPKPLILRTYDQLSSGYNELYKKTKICLSEDFFVIEDPLFKNNSSLSKEYWNAPELWICTIPDGEYLSFKNDKRDKKNYSILTMWESTKLPSWQIKQLEGFNKVIVPSKWNKECFISGGYRNVDIVNLFVDEKVYFGRPKTRKLDKFVFSTGGLHLLTTGNDKRKDISSIIGAFKKEFQNDKDVELHIRLSENDYYKQRRLIDDQIKFFKMLPKEEDYAEFIADTDAFISPAKSEGWGFMQIQSIAVGRPVISPNYSSLAEFLNKDNCFSVEYDEILASGNWGLAGGLWANVKLNSLRKQMRLAFDKKDELRANWQKCSNSVINGFSIKEYKSRLLNSLNI